MVTETVEVEIIFELLLLLAEAIGMVLGVISKFIFPSLLLDSPALQMLSIMVMPFLVAFVVWKISLWIDTRRRHQLYYRNYWMFGYL